MYKRLAIPTEFKTTNFKNQLEQATEAILCYNYCLKLTTSCLLINGCFMFSILVDQCLSLFYLTALVKLFQNICEDSAAFWGWTSWSITTKSVLTTKSGPNGSWNFGRWPVNLGNSKQRMAHIKAQSIESKERCPLYSCVQSDRIIRCVRYVHVFARLGDILWDPPLDTRTTFLFLYWDFWSAGLCPCGSTSQHNCQSFWRGCTWVLAYPSFSYTLWRCKNAIP